MGKNRQTGRLRSPLSFGELGLAELGGGEEAAGEGLIEQVLGQFIREALEMDEVDGLGDHVTRMTAAKLLAGIQVVRGDERIDQPRRRWSILSSPRTT